MPTYLVDRNVPGLSRDQFRAAQRALGQAAAANGRKVRYVRALFVPSEGRAMCLFEAPDESSVRAVNLAAGVPFTHVVEVVDLIAESAEPEESDTPCAYS